MKQTFSPETPNYESSTLPYVCWYQNDFLKGVRGMRAHEIGIYTILLNEMYVRGRPINLSPERLARLCGCDKRTFVRALEMLISEGKILNLASGLWNKRCDNVFQEREKLLTKKAYAGFSSARKRKQINANIQQLLNRHDRSDEQNSEVQKREEKETPCGVLEKTPHLLVSSPSAHEGGSEVRTDSSTLCPDLSAVSPPVCSSEDVSGSGSFPPSPPPCANVLRGHRLPRDWTADIQAAVSEGLSDEQARWQEKKFRDYWSAKSGKEALKVDWQATWRNWFRREIERLRDTGTKPNVSLTFSPHKVGSSPLPCDDDTLYRSLINYPLDERA